MEPRPKNVEIRKLMDTLVGASTEKFIGSSKCVMCQGPATEFDDIISEKEFVISGMCQSCQDDIFEGPHDDRELRL